MGPSLLYCQCCHGVFVRAFFVATPGDVTNYLELINWMLRRHDDETSVATLVETLNVAVQREDEDELSSAKRLRRLNTECGLMYGEGALRGLFLESVHRAARATVLVRNIAGMTMVELARLAQTNSYEHRWLRHEQRTERTKEREPLAKETRLGRQVRLAATPRVSGGTRTYPPRDAPVRVVGPVDSPNRVVEAVDDPTPGCGDNPRRRPRQGDDASRPISRTGEHP